MKILFMVMAVWLAIGAGGCGMVRRPVTIEPVGRKQAVIQPKFSSITYRVDQDGTLYFVGRASTYDKALNETVEQMLTARVFWRPKGGVTSMNPTSLNATYRYVVMTSTAVGMYEGAGFIRIRGKPGKGKIDARLMDGDLRLSEASTSFVDNIGRCRVRGNFTARYDEAATMETMLQSHRDFFYRSQNLKPEEKKGAETAPGTQPATRTSRLE